MRSRAGSRSSRPNSSSTSSSRTSTPTTRSSRRSGAPGRPEVGRQSYSIAAVNEFDPLFDDIYAFCEAQEIEIDTLIHEDGAAQMEINLIHGDAMSLADQVFMFKRTAREAALRHKMYATFMAKPMAREPGSSMHIHQSVVDAKTGKNVFSDKDGNPSPLFFAHIAGLQKYLPSAMSLFAPNVNSFRRIILRHMAPINTQWGYDNRTAGLRVPISNAENRRVENRLGGADANPYLAIAASLACGYLGMLEGLKPSEPVSGSAYDLPFGLPRNLEESVRLLRDCRPLIDLLGERFVLAYTAVKESETRHVPAGDQLLGARAPAAQRLRRPPMSTAIPYVADRTTDAWQELDRQHYLHPFTDYKSLHAKGARVIVRAEGVYLYDSDGNRILDGMAGLWCVNLGYGRRELAEAAYRQMLELPYYNSFFQTAHPPVIELAKQLVDLTPPQFNRVFFTGSGSEGNDTVVRLVRRYWDLLGEPRAQGDHQPRQRLPRQHDGRREPRRHGVHARAGRPADSGHRPHPAAVLVRRGRRPVAGRVRPADRAGARAEDRGARRRPRRGLHRRADPGRGRRDHPAGHLLAGDPAHLRPARHPAGRRRGDLRLRPHRALVRLRPVRHPPGPDDRSPRGCRPATCRSAASWSATGSPTC